MRSELFPRQLDSEGNLGRAKDICVVAAERTFKERWGKDTNPMIVQMIIFGALQDHWYYRSDQWVDQPYSLPAMFTQPYRGDPQFAYPWLYGEGTFQRDDELTELMVEELSTK